ncbi:hypothetical protein Ddc_06043 [Ditylenchus destructor]|nr:hypothetical protein Ddc_06043 [Ditylenchus destructor]
MFTFSIRTCHFVHRRGSNKYTPPIPYQPNVGQGDSHTIIISSPKSGVFMRLRIAIILNLQTCHNMLPARNSTLRNSDDTTIVVWTTIITNDLVVKSSADGQKKDDRLVDRFFQYGIQPNSLELWSFAFFVHSRSVHNQPPQQNRQQSSRAILLSVSTNERRKRDTITWLVEFRPGEQIHNTHQQSIENEGDRCEERLVKRATSLFWLGSALLLICLGYKYGKESKEISRDIEKERGYKKKEMSITNSNIGNNWIGGMA